MALKYREHGTRGPRVVALHGGPAAPGNIAPLARTLADSCRVLEPWQSGSGGVPLSVDRHVAALRAFLDFHCGDERPAVVGESWGAMLALAFAAAHPQMPSRLILVGCGTFDAESRRVLHAALEARKTPELRAQVAALDLSNSQHLPQLHELMLRLYEYDPLPAPPDADAPPFDAAAHHETWRDMLRQQELGRYPAAFAAIACPVCMIHGAYDPHPGPMIRDSLRAYLPQLEYHELPRCGHTPWLECQAQEPFYRLLRDKLQAPPSEPNLC